MHQFRRNGVLVKPSEPGCVWGSPRNSGEPNIAATGLDVSFEVSTSELVDTGRQRAGWYRKNRENPMKSFPATDLSISVLSWIGDELREQVAQIEQEERRARITSGVRSVIAAGLTGGMSLMLLQLLQF